MAVYETTFKLQRDLPQYKVSQMFPELTFASWCNHNRDLLEISTEEEGPEAMAQIELAIDVLKKELGFKVARKTISENSAQVVTQSCICKTFSNTTTKVVEANNGLKIEPVFFKRGWGLWRVLSFHEADMRNMFSQLESSGTLKVLSRRSLNGSSVKDTFTISATGMLGGLTRKQSLALQAALMRGYYDIPKRTSTDEIARSLGLPRTTFEEHLRKAESKAMKGILPLLMFSGTKQSSGPRKARLAAPEELVPSIAA